MVWLGGDYHFRFKNILKYREFDSLENMENHIITNHNAMVKEGDTFICIGDFCEGVDPKELLPKMNGHFLFVRGNHDTHPFFKNMPDGIFLRRKGFNIYITHDPRRGRSFNHIDLVICGHVHQHWRIRNIGNKMYINVGVDVNDFKPVSLPGILDHFSVKKSDVKRELRRFVLDHNSIRHILRRG